MPYKNIDEQKAAQHKSYLKHKKTVQQRGRAIILRNRKFVRRYRRLCKCRVCGENRPPCLDFHHRNPDEKVATIAYMIKNRQTIKRIKEEIRKCDVLCANCHRLEHSDWIIDSQY